MPEIDGPAADCPHCGRSHAGSDLCAAALLQLGLKAPLPAGTRLGPYEIVSAIGAGGMGEVYRARDERLKRDVAVKVLPSTMSEDPGRLERFQREAQAASALNHPNILAVYDVGSEDGRPYIVSELLEGETLMQRLAGGPLPLRRAMDYAAQMAKGLAAAHGKGIVHRDVKPENVFVTKDEHVKILDFGLAKVAESASEPGSRLPTGGGGTEPGVVMGTLAYMSPEQVRGERLDARSDIFSFGSVLFEMATGKAAFGRRTAADTMSAILKEEPEEGLLPAGLDEIVRHCLEKEPSRRFQSAGDIAFNLTSGTTKALQGGVRPSAAGRRGAVAAAVVVVLLAAGAVMLTRRPRPASAPAVKRVAVLPFENLGAAEDDYFADGMADEVRSKLSSLAGIEVIARASSTPYKKTTKTPIEIARELGARYLLTATVRWQKAAGASRVHVTPELVEVRESGAPASTWGQPFDGSLTDVFRVQSEIAEQVARSLSGPLGIGERKRLAEAPTANLDAYDAFLKGEELWGIASSDPASLRKVLNFFEQAVELDPGYAQAWAKVSRASSVLYINGGPDPGLAEKARRAAERAVALAPSRPEGYLALGNQKFMTREFAEALEQLTKGRRLAPNDSELLRDTAYSEAALGRWDDSVRHFREAVALDPRSANNAAGLGGILVGLRRYREAREALDRGLEVTPGNLDLVGTKAICALMEGDLAGARAILGAAEKSVDRATVVAYVASVGDVGWALDREDRSLLLRLTPSAFDGDRGVWGLCLAQASAWDGKPDDARRFAAEAREALEEEVRVAPGDPERHLSLGLALAYLGQRERAIREGEAGVALDPMSKDAYNGPYYQHQLARIYVILGEPERALGVLEPLLKVPYLLSPGLLRIDPNFDSLRSNPRFQKLVAQP